MVAVNSQRTEISTSSDLKQHIIILGGGIAGLTTAQVLLQRNCQVTLIEKAPEVGGLARTLDYDGFRFDLGGHRFHSNNPSVVQWLKDLLGDDLLVVPRISHIYLNQRFVDYPIQLPKALSIFSPLKALNMGLSYLGAKVTERTRPDESFEDWVVKRYGRALYEVFFQPYTEKVWGIPCNQLSAQWAAQRIGIPSMLRMVQHALAPAKNTPATAISEFYYPRNGFGDICQALRREILAMGGVIHTGTTLLTCTPSNGQVDVAIQHANGDRQVITANQAVSTIPLNALLQSISNGLGSDTIMPSHSLEYRDLICLFIALNKPQVSQDSWTYFPMQNLTFGRTHEPKNWSAAMVPSNDCTSLAIEIFANRGEDLWNMANDDILAQVVDQMDQIGWISKADVKNSWVLRVPYAYPVYRVGYETQLNQVKTFLSQWPQIHLVGRTGSFRYLNSDGVVEDVFRFADDLFPQAASLVKPLEHHSGRWM